MQLCLARTLALFPVFPFFHVLQRSVTHASTASFTLFARTTRTLLSHCAPRQASCFVVSCLFRSLLFPRKGMWNRGQSTSLPCVPAATESVQDASQDLQQSSGITSPVDVSVDVSNAPEVDNIPLLTTHVYRVDTLFYTHNEIAEVRKHSLPSAA